MNFIFSSESVLKHKTVFVTDNRVFKGEDVTCCSAMKLRSLLRIKKLFKMCEDGLNTVGNTYMYMAIGVGWSNYGKHLSLYSNIYNCVSDI